MRTVFVLFFLQVLAACGVDVEVHLLVVMSLLIYVPGTFVRKLQHLAPLSGVATIVQVLSIFVILGYLGTHTNIAEMRIAPFKPALFFGVAVFSLEGICLVSCWGSRNIFPHLPKYCLEALALLVFTASYCLILAILEFFWRASFLFLLGLVPPV